MKSKGTLCGGAGPIVKQIAANAVSVLKLTIPAGEATPGPPIGAALGQKGVKAIDFCKQFNEKSLQIYRKGIPLRCFVSVTNDRKFSFEIKPPATIWLIKQAISLEKASTKYHVATVSPQVLYEVAKIKSIDPRLRGRSLEGIYRMIIASSKACGIKLLKE